MQPSSEVSAPRFRFGRNWAGYVRTIDAEAIAEARQSLATALGTGDLSDRTFLDIGSGSGLFSLAARQMGAIVSSFDYDEDSVACTAGLREKYCPGDSGWTVQRGSVLDKGFLGTLGRFDVVYSWGVLHHTGAMWEGIQNAAALVNDAGMLFIAIYNDQGLWSRVWLVIKRIYNKLPAWLRVPYVIAITLPLELRSLAYSLLTLQPMRYVRGWTHYKSARGMNKWHDMVDWVGGLPFEVAKPEQVIFFLLDRGFELKGLKTWAGATACNEFVVRYAARTSR
ncbi:MAG TPA: class I SAM-dependent methyltransferase [Povalibacter sp.]|nr:class I SAM-dependent methyltransferase [Povalibacter sp.]